MVSWGGMFDGCLMDELDNPKVDFDGKHTSAQLCVLKLETDIPSSAEVTKTKPVAKQCYLLPLAGNFAQ